MKPNNLTIENVATVLNPEDKLFCDDLFEKYKKIQTILKEICDQGKSSNHNYNMDYKENNPFKKESQILNAHLNKVTDLLETSSKSLVIKIEQYFRKKYGLTFPSLLKTQPNEVNFILIDYNLVIANMIQHTGAYFSYVTKEGALEAAPSLNLKLY